MISNGKLTESVRLRISRRPAELGLLDRRGERGDRAEADEDGPGDVALDRREARAAAESLTERARHEGPRGVAERAQDGKEQPEDEDLHPRRAAARVDELRRKARKKSAVFGLRTLTTMPCR